MTTSAQSWSWKLGLVSWLTISGAIASGESALAQITPDTTLGSENSTVTSTGAVDSINGGATKGANLFHSFQEFSIDEGRAAVFTNPAGIENILTRVTGANPSNIFGTLGVSGGNANLFLINPNGIIFGPNARLDVGGSFVGTTANAIAFGNQGFFSASNPETASSLLTVNPSALLFNQIRAASIKNNSVADSGLNPPSSDFTATGLRVPDGKSLLLVGGDINMDGGGLFAVGGRVELGGLAGAGTVGLNEDGNNLSLSFPNSVERSDVFLSNGAGAGVTAGDGGSIAVNAQNLEMTIGSFLFAGIESGLGSDNSKAGNIEVNATGAINLDTRSLIANQVRAEANGRGGNVSISASTLRVEDGAQVGVNTFGSGKAGSLTVDAKDVQIIGRSANGKAASALATSAEPNSTGDAGNLSIKTNSLLVQDGAQVGAATSGQGKGGNLRVDAIDVQLIGRGSGLFASAVNSTGDAGNLSIKTNTLKLRDGAQVSAGTFAAGKGGNLRVDAIDVQLIGRGSGLRASAQPKSTGDAGNLSIKTDTLLVQDGAQVNVSTVGEGKGGDLTIKTNTLKVKDGAQVGAATFAAGQGGNLRVDAIDVQLIGRLANGRFGSSLGASAQPNSTGDAGNLLIKTDTLLVQDGAAVNVRSFGTGTAGNLTIDARSIRLNNNGLLTASTRSATVDPNSEQATININSQNLIMRRGSNIRTNATGENVIGGNININSDIIAALENSNISANSANFRGGNVRIDAQAIFGTQFRDVASDSTSDITATGASPEFSGNVELNTLNTDVNSGLVNLPTVPVDTEVAQACTPGGSQAQSEFVVTGRGGLPPNPTEALSSDAIQIDWVTLNPDLKRPSNPVDVSTNKINPTLVPIVEAQGWMTDDNGNIVLTATPATVTAHIPWLTAANCNTAKTQS